MNRYYDVLIFKTIEASLILKRYVRSKELQDIFGISKNKASKMIKQYSSDRDGALMYHGDTKEWKAKSSWRETPAYWSTVEVMDYVRGLRQVFGKTLTLASGVKW